VNDLLADGDPAHRDLLVCTALATTVLSMGALGRRGSAWWPHGDDRAGYDRRAKGQTQLTRAVADPDAVGIRGDVFHAHLPARDERRDERRASFAQHLMRGAF